MKRLHVETTNFDFEAFSETEDQAIELFHHAWSRHNEQYQVGLTSQEALEEFGYRIDAIAQGLVLRDGEEIVNLPVWERAYQNALEMMDGNGLEPTSAFKQAASDCGLSFGSEMAAFVKYAHAKIVQ